MFIDKAKSAVRQRSAQRLERRREEMPIIDQALAPPDKLKKRHPWSYVWLRVLRPVLLGVFWIVALRYVWRHLISDPDDLPIEQQIALYTVAVVVIIVAMLLLAPIRRREVQEELERSTFSSSAVDTSSMSDFTNVTADELEDLQYAQRLVVYHDAHGAIDRAEDTDSLLDFVPTGPAALAPEGLAARPPGPRVSP